MATGISVHIGLNAVNPRHYMGWSGPLAACEYDARDMARIAESLGYAAHDRSADEAGHHAAGDLCHPGRCQGHSAPETLLPHLLRARWAGDDTNGDEATRDYGEMGEVGDTKDETWCLYDRQLIDDELYALWAEFPAAVPHLRALRLLPQRQRDPGGTGLRPHPRWRRERRRSTAQTAARRPRDAGRHGG